MHWLNKKTLPWIGLAVVLTIASVVFVRTKKTNDASQGSSALRVGYLNIVACLPVLVAADEGLFAKNGLRVQLIELKTGNEVATAAITHRIDVIGGAAVNAVLDAMQASGAECQIFMANEYTLPLGDRPATDILVARKEIKSTLELSGKTIRIYPGSVGRAFAKAVLPKLGLSLDSVKLVEIPAVQMLAALKTGSVDAITALYRRA